MEKEIAEYSPEVTMNVLVDWQMDIVDMWFNSSAPGGLIDLLTSNNLYHQIEEVDITAFYELPTKGSIKTAARKWFRNRIKEIINEASAKHKNFRIFIIRGCTAQERLSFHEPIREYARKNKQMDDDTMIRIGQRFAAHFINQTPGLIFPEKPYNEFVDTMFEHCSSWCIGNEKVTLVSSETLLETEMINIIINFFPTCHCEIYQPPKPDNSINHNLMILEPSTRYFGELFKKNGIKVKDDSSEAAMILTAKTELEEKLKRAL